MRVVLAPPERGSRGVADSGCQRWVKDGMGCCKQGYGGYFVQQNQLKTPAVMAIEELHLCPGRSKQQHIPHSVEKSHSQVFTR